MAEVTPVRTIVGVPQSLRNHRIKGYSNVNQGQGVALSDFYTFNGSQMLPGRTQ